MNIGKCSLKELAEISKNLGSEVSNELISSLISRIIYLIDEPDTHTLSDLVVTFGNYRSHIVKPFMEKAASRLDVSLLNFRQTAQTMYPISAYKVQNPEFYKKTNSKLIDTIDQFERSDQKSLSKIVNWMSVPLKAYKSSETVYHVFEKKIFHSEHLIKILQGYVLGQKGSHELYSHMHEMITSNLDSFSPVECGLSLHYLSKVEGVININTQVYLEYLLSYGDFDTIVGSIQDFIYLKADPRKLIEKALSVVSSARTLSSITVLEWACKLFDLEIPESMRQQRRVLFFLSTNKDVMKDFRLRYNIRNLNS